MLSLIHVLDGRAAATPDTIALTDDQGGELTYAGLAAARRAAAVLDDPVPVRLDVVQAPAAGAGLCPPRPAGRLCGAQPAVLPHTSGTTGAPKLVPLTHQQLVSAALFMKLEVPEALPGARHLSALPLFHLAGLANLAYVLVTGGQLHLLSGFDVASFVTELADRQIQFTQLVPTLIQAVTQEVSSRATAPDLSGLTEIVYGASPIRPGVLGRAVRVLRCRFRQNYASSETGPLPITSLSPADHDPALGLLGAAGRPSLGWEVRLGDQDEIQVPGAEPLPGCFANPAATGTGRHCRCGRSRRPSARRQLAAELIGFARAQLAGFKCPAGVTLVPSLPRNATGKVLRAPLREPFWAGRDRQVS